MWPKRHMPRQKQEGRRGLPEPLPGAVAHYSSASRCLWRAAMARAACTTLGSGEIGAAQIRRRAELRCGLDGKRLGRP
jgi:hypothetical protein